MATYEQWKSNWDAAFTKEALDSVFTMPFMEMNRTFVRVQMLSKGMMKTWFDLLRRNHPRLIVASQMSVSIAGPCKLYMCYLTTNHVDFRDPTAISCATPMYTNAPFICFQGLMELNSTLQGGGSIHPNETISLLIMSSKTAPRDEKVSYQYIFISPKPCIGKALRELLEAKDVNFNRCVAGTLYSVFQTHEKKKCSCCLSVSNWKEIGIVREYQVDELMAILPTISFKGVKMGMINVPWVSGYSFDLIKQNGWVVEDEGIASLTERWLAHTDALRAQAQTTSFLSVLAGIDGIHAIDFIKFVTLDPMLVEERSSFK